MTCDLCHDSISAARLAAVPTTRLCRECRELADEPALTAYSPLIRRALVEMSASTGEQERAIEQAGGRL